MQVKYLAQGYKSSVLPRNQLYDIEVTRPVPYPLCYTVVP
uniref:Uncharacterized protein n=1 Tax=Anguilla anguilla TaxID=7936 RepID=A0A0E9TD81_ANGAN